MKVKDLDDAKVFQCCHEFLGKPGRPSPTEVARILTREWGLKVDVKHTDIYPIVAEGVSRDLVRLQARPSARCTEELVRRFGHAKESIHVLAARGESAIPAVADAAADHILKLILRLGDSKQRVHIGFVGGRTVMAVAHKLAANMRRAERLPKLALHAVCSGFDALHPETAPISFFGYFKDVPADVEYVGLFAPPVVDAKDYERVKNGRGVVESFRKAEEIHLVVTSLSAAADRHGPLKDLQDVSEVRLGGLHSAVGDVSYCPYSNEGPILLDSGPRAMTLFQISDLVELAARRDKHVVLVASPCPAPDCGRLRADALLPLLANPKLKLWSSLFLDEETAERVAKARATDPDA